MNTAVLVLGWMCAFGAIESTEPIESYQRLEGVWDVQEVVRDGVLLKEPGLARLIFHKGELCFTPEVGAAPAYSYRLARSPLGAMDLTEDKRTIRAIYAIDPRGQLRVCFDPDSRERPTRFASTKGSGLTFITLRKN